MTVCEFCGQPVNPADPGVYEKMEGWVKRRSEGGTNALVLRRALRVFACRVCITAARKGISLDQEQLTL